MDSGFIERAQEILASCGGTRAVADDRREDLSRVARKINETKAKNAALEQAADTKREELRKLLADEALPPKVGAPSAAEIKRRKGELRARIEQAELEILEGRDLVAGLERERTVAESALGEATRAHEKEYRQAQASLAFELNLRFCRAVADHVAPILRLMAANALGGNLIGMSARLKGFRIDRPMMSMGAVVVGNRVIDAQGETAEEIDKSWRSDAEASALYELVRRVAVGLSAAEQISAMWPVGGRT